MTDRMVSIGRVQNAIKEATNAVKDYANSSDRAFALWIVRMTEECLRNHGALPPKKQRAPR